MSHRISDTLTSTWSSLIDERLNVLTLAVGLFLMTLVAFFAVVKFSTDGLTATSLVAIFAPGTGFLLFVMKNIHDKNVELKKKDDLAFFFLIYLFEQHNLKALEKSLTSCLTEIQFSLNSDFQNIPTERVKAHLDELNDNVGSNLKQIEYSLHKFNPTYFHNNTGACFNIKQQVGAAILNLIETVDKVKGYFKESDEVDQRRKKVFEVRQKEYVRKYISQTFGNNKIVIVHPTNQQILTATKRILATISTIESHYEALKSKNKPEL